LEQGEKGGCMMEKEKERDGKDVKGDFVKYKKERIER
jgi:hypothetical protein